MIDALLALLTLLGGPSAVFPAVLTALMSGFGGALLYLVQRHTRLSEKREEREKLEEEARKQALRDVVAQKIEDNREALSMATITVKALYDTRESFVAMEAELREQNRILRVERDGFQNLYNQKREELSEALGQIREQNRTIDRMQKEIDHLRDQVHLLQSGSSTRTTELHIVQETVKE